MGTVARGHQQVTAQSKNPNPAGTDAALSEVAAKDRLIDLLESGAIDAALFRFLTSRLSPATAVLREREAARFIGMSTHYLRHARIGLCGPGPDWIKVGNRGIRYRVEDLSAWLASRVAAKPRRRSAA